MLFFTLSSVGPNLYEQRDPDNPKLRRESDELFLKDPIPALNLQLVHIHIMYQLYSTCSSVKVIIFV